MNQHAQSEGQASAERMTGSQAIIRSLEMLGVTDLFGLPGGAILPTYDPLMDSEKLRHILVRHEQGAGHAAQGYALATGKVGVCIATSGPGATNLVTAIADAHMDSVPLLAITGQVFSSLLGTDAFQEADIVGITMPITKHSYVVSDAQDIPRVLHEAYVLASTGRPGPVLVDITKDAQQNEMDFLWSPSFDVPGYKPNLTPHTKPVKEAISLLASARKPVAYVGGGVLKAHASEELAEFVHLMDIPVVTTLTARGAFPDSDPLHLGMPGMHGAVAAVLALQEADVILAIGTRFDDRVTGRLDSFAPKAKIIHMDVDPAEISKNRMADVPMVSDAKNGLIALTAAARKLEHLPDYSTWGASVQGLKAQFPLGYADSADGLLEAQKVIERLSQHSGSEAVYCAGVGQHQMWAAQFVKYERPHQWLNSAGLGTMGFSVPAAMGAKVGQPERTVWAIDGDGCFQMTNQELATCVINDIPIKVAIINNSSLGMVRQWQKLFYSERFSNTDLNTGHGTIRVPDFVKLAEAYGAVGLRCEREEDLDDVIQQALAISDRPVVVDFVVSPDSMVWPMVPAGVPNNQIQIARDRTPEWNMEEN